MTPTYPERRTLLISACLEESEDRAHRALQDWSDMVPFKQVDSSEIIVLPWLHHRFGERIDRAYSDNVKGVVRKAIYRSSILKSEASEITTGLDNSGIRHAWFRDLAIANVVYHPHEIRPVNQLDLFFLLPDVHSVVELVKSHGWNTKSSNLAGLKFMKDDVLELNARWLLCSHWDEYHNNDIVTEATGDLRLAALNHLIFDLLNNRFNGEGFTGVIDILDFYTLMNTWYSADNGRIDLINGARNFYVSNKLIAAVQTLGKYVRTKWTDDFNAENVSPTEIELLDRYMRYLDTNGTADKIRYHKTRQRLLLKSGSDVGKNFLDYSLRLFRQRNRTRKWLKEIQ